MQSNGLSAIPQIENETASRFRNFSSSARRGGRSGSKNTSSPFSVYDVVSGRGGLANTHAGNCVFRRLVDYNKDCYKSLESKSDKSRLVDSIILAIQQSGGRFLTQNPKTEIWEEVPYKKAFLKTSQALREDRREKPTARDARRERAESTEFPLSLKDCDGEEDIGTLITTSSTYEDDEFMNERKEDKPMLTRDDDERTVVSQDAPQSTKDIFAFHPVHVGHEEERIPAPPLLRLYSSALNPFTSKIAGAIEDQRAETCERPIDEMLFDLYTSVPPPPLSFDDIIARQDSLGISSTLAMPDLARETSMAFTASVLIDC